MNKVRLFIDEVGNTDLNIALTHPHERYLSLTGVVLKARDYHEIFTSAFMNIKMSFFNNPDVVFHRRKLLHAQTPFAALKDPEIRSRFNDQLISILNDLPFNVITVAIDKRELLEVSDGDDPYHLAFFALLDVFLLHLEEQDISGDVTIERRQKQQDRRLKNEFEQQFVEGPRVFYMQKRLTSHTLKFANKADNCPGTQLADLLAYPSSKAVCRGDVALRGSDFTARVNAVLEQGKYLSRRAKFLLPQKKTGA